MGDDAGGVRRDWGMITPDFTWMTYQDLAEFLGMKTESARRRAQREDWPRQLGNDGRTRVAVPGDVIAGEGSSRVTDAGDDHPSETAALRELAGALRAQITKLEAQAERERQDHLAQLVKAEAAAERARTDYLAERERLAEAQTAMTAAREAWEARLDGLAADLAEARQARLVEAETNARREVELQRMQAEMERLRVRPWWRRMFGVG